MKRILNLLLSLTVCTTVWAGNVQKDTYIFKTTEHGDTLRMDRYSGSIIDGNNRSSLIFVYGGSFRCGQRDDAAYVPMFKFLANNGVDVFAIDYRTALSDVWYEDVDTPAKLVGKLVDAINVAVSDLLSATSFIVDHSKEWGINPDGIVSCGSSAGAITVLQAEYYICNGVIPKGTLPDGFNYAGVIPMAGAIFAPDSLQWASNPAPLLMFHGDADNIVPFDNGYVEGLGGLWGSNAISQSLEDASYQFHVVHGIGHEMAGLPMQNNKGEILDFIRALSNQKKGVHKVIVKESMSGISAPNTDYNYGESLQNIFPKRP